MYTRAYELCQQVEETAQLAPVLLALLAEAHGYLRQLAEGLSLLTEALTVVDATDERWCEPDLYRLKGELLLARSAADQTEAETCLQHALALARCQQARSWELRTALILSRLWLRHGKQEEARQLLEEVSVGSPRALIRPTSRRQSAVRSVSMNRVTSPHIYVKGCIGHNPRRKLSL